MFFRYVLPNCVCSDIKDAAVWISTKLVNYSTGILSIGSRIRLGRCICTPKEIHFDFHRLVGVVRIRLNKGFTVLVHSHKPS